MSRLINALRDSRGARRLIQTITLNDGPEYPDQKHGSTANWRPVLVEEKTEILSYIDYVDEVIYRDLEYSSSP